MAGAFSELTTDFEITETFLKRRSCIDASSTDTPIAITLDSNNKLSIAVKKHVLSPLVSPCFG
jgi:hypothetical protein